MAYRSKVDIKLGEIPKTTDTDLLPDMIDVYNAIHILNQYIDVVAEAYGKNTGDPWDTFQFKWHLELPAGRDIKRGQGVTLVRGKFVPGWQAVSEFMMQSVGTVYRETGGGDQGPGWYEPGLVTSVATLPLGQRRSGIATHDADAGELLSVAIGPGIIEADDLSAGTVLMVYPYNGAVTGSGHGGGTRQNQYDGNMYKYRAPGKNQYVITGWAVGEAIIDNAIFIPGHFEGLTFSNNQRIQSGGFLNR